MATGKYQKWLAPEGRALLEGWARDGLTDAQIAHNIGIRRSTLYEWKRRYPDISDALKKGKEVVDREVENSLLKRAVGMKTKSTTYKMVKVNEDVLKVKRARFLNEYKLDHPDMSRQNLMMAAVENVPTYEQIPLIVNENELAPDTSAAIFWMKNRKPEQYRDHSFQELNNAQAEKARADVRKSNAEADIAEARAASEKDDRDDQMGELSKLLDTLTKETMDSVEEDGRGRAGDESRKTQSDVQSQTGASPATGAAQQKLETDD
ncbi:MULTISPECIES: terminase [Levilactobacillus]|uniref:terminase n=1 Tax=Levilactobacillus TaxID=2767886 RepID=UPI001CECAD0E|nr:MULTISPECIES: terminase [Levilactobacillus]